MLVETMYNCFSECANIYETENGNAVVTYENQNENETMKRYFTSYEKAVDYLWRHGYRW